MNALHQWTRLSDYAKQPLVQIAALTVLAATVAFYRLGDGTLYGDEAAFACTTERMRTTGDWIVPYLGDAPHLNATPLYNWLTLPLVHWCGESPFWHRFWSAAFGVGCVLLTYRLGAILFRAEVGFLAGVFLALNRDFYFSHGVRFGGMDAMTAFFLTAAVLAYATRQHRSQRESIWWAITGASLGLACLSKPPVFGVFFFTILAAHHLWVRRREGWLASLRGPLLALGMSMVVAGPWYFLIWLRLGHAGLFQLFVFNSVVRSIDSQPVALWQFHKALWHASNGFKLLEVAFVCAAACWWLKHLRPRWELLLAVAGSFLFALAVAGKVNANYTYYVYPLLSVLLAAMLLEAWPWLARRVADRAAWSRRGLRAGVATAGLAIAADFGLVVPQLAAPAWIHPPLEAYVEVLPALEQQQCRFIMYDFMHAQRSTAQPAAGTNFEELYYGPRMARAEWVDSIDELRQLLADGQPTIVVLPPIGAPTPAMAEICRLDPDHRIDLGAWPQWTYPVLSFHQASAASYPARLGAGLSRGVTASFFASRPPANRESR